MFIATLPYPEALTAALAKGSAAEVLALAGPTPAEAVARALALAAQGKEDEARAALAMAEAAGGEVALAAKLELAFLDLRRRAATPAALLKIADAIAEAAPKGSLLAARAHHLAGLAENFRRELESATDRLLQATELYRAGKSRIGAAQVADSLGQVLSSRGRVDLATLYYALSLADKALLGDKVGLAITLGNLGRLALQQGRYSDAIAFFERDIELLQQLSDQRAEARLQCDLGRALLGLGDFKAARVALAKGKTLAEGGGFPDILLQALAEGARAALSDGDLAGAASAIAEAKGKLPEKGFQLERAMLQSAEGQALAAKGDKAGLSLMQEAAQRFADATLPDAEIATRLALGEAAFKLGEKAVAEEAIFAAMSQAKQQGFVRYLTRLRELLERLELKSEAAGGYVIRSRLGGGAFGTVYRAFDLEAGRTVAFKRLHLASLFDAEERQRLWASARTELEAAQRLNHPGVVRIYAIGSEANGDAYVVQELVEGEALENIIARPGQKNLRDVAAMLARIAQALAALHNAGVVHRDLKPGNVIVKNGWQPVLVDFGISYVPGKTQASKENLGTLEYVAPEQAEGESADAKADLYALGVMAYEWLTGKRPLEIPPDLESALKVIRKNDPVPIAKLRPDLPKEASALIDQLLEKKPRRRPENAAEVADRFEALAK